MTTCLYRFTGILGLIFLLHACAGTPNQPYHDQTLPLIQLVEQAPVENRIQSILLYDAILAYGQDGIIEICGLLESTEQKRKAQAEYILHGLAYYVNGVDKDGFRHIYHSGLKQSLLSNRSLSSKQFIIRQLQITGQDDAVPVLSTFLNDDVLSYTAIQALTAIGTESAGRALIDALQESPPDQQIAIISALGNIHYKPCAETLLPFLDDTDYQISKAAYFALANLGFLPVAETLERMKDEDHRFLPSFLNYLNNIAAQGQTKRAQAICREIVDDPNHFYTTNQRISALCTLAGIDSMEAIDELIMRCIDENKTIRMAALDLANHYHQSAVSDQLVKIAKESEPPTQADIIAMLAVRNDSLVVSFLQQSLNSTAPEMRLAAISAYARLLKTESLGDICFRLNMPLSPDEQSVIEKAIVAYADSMSLHEIFNRYDEYPEQSQTLLISCMIQIGNNPDNPVWYQSLSSKDSLLRATVIEGMLHFGDDSVLTQLTDLIKKNTSRAEQQEAIRAIIVIINRSDNKKEIIDELLDSFNLESESNRLPYFEIFRGIGGKRLLAKTFESVSNPNSDISDSAIRSLTLWPDEDALDLLLDIVRNHMDQKYRILALQGAIRILRENQIEDLRALQYYAEIVPLAHRAEEKRQILAGLSDLSDPKALTYIVTLMKDKEIENEAFLAAMKIAISEKMTSKDMAFALLPQVTQGNIQAKIDQYKMTNLQINTPPEGFTALFNGQDLSGWKGLVADPVKRAQMTPEMLQQAQSEADELMRAHWRVIDGVLYFDGKGASLCTQKNYRDFELFVDWKIEKKGDSGIYLRGSPQIQIWDMTIRQEGSGGLYNNQRHPNTPLKSADHSPGKWNTFRIIMRGEKVTVYLNDILVVNNVIMENYWERDRPIYPSGQIELQAHNTPLYFRNIYIRELEPKPLLFSGSLFNGINLDGWQVIGNTDQSWRVKDGVLFSDGEGGGWLSTTRIFADFKLSLEFRVPPGGNSGVFIRAPHDGDPAYTGIEVQVLDDYANEYADLKPWQYTGSLYGLQAPLQRESKNADHWQKMEISCKGPGISVVLNGVNIIDANLIDFMVNEKKHPGIKRRSGYIGLQNHNTKIEFRNIQLSEL